MKIYVLMPVVHDNEGISFKEIQIFAQLHSLIGDNSADNSQLCSEWWQMKSL